MDDTVRISRRTLSGALAAILAGGIGCFTLINVIGDVFVPGFDVNSWWIELRPLPASTARFFLCLCGITLLAWGLWGKFITVARWVSAILAIVAVLNSISFISLARAGAIRPGATLPFSVYVGLCLVFIAIAARKGKFRPAGTNLKVIVSILTLGVLMVMFPLGQMKHFGETDYSRRADAIVVFGAGVYSDGSPSDAVSDRVLTACQLYNQGLAGKVIVSGGPGMGETHETTAMRKLAISAGVREEDIIIGPTGLSTQATVNNTIEMSRRLGLRKLLVVSHDYHLPRIKMCYQRSGVEVYTVPARQARPLKSKPYFMAREVAALWVYYLRPLAG